MPPPLVKLSTLGRPHCRPHPREIPFQVRSDELFDLGCREFGDFGGKLSQNVGFENYI
jgi:hypothetical protein